MVIDLWLKIGSAASYPLVLQMLHQCLQDEDLLVRAQAFDVVYNLSIHARMLMNNGDDLDAVEDPWDQHTADTRWVPTPSSQSASPLPSCTTPMSDRAPSTHRLHPLQEEPEEALPRNQGLTDRVGAHKSMNGSLSEFVISIIWQSVILDGI